MNNQVFSKSFNPGLCLVVAVLGLSACTDPQPPTTTPAADTGERVANDRAADAGADASVEAGPIAATRAGQVRGFIEDGVLVFKGVRYGSDTAKTRFAAPMPPQPWTGVRDARSYGPSAPQIPYPPGVAGGLFDSWLTDPAPTLGEDALFLNVWTRALHDGRKRPVMVRTYP